MGKKISKAEGKRIKADNLRKKQEKFFKKLEKIHEQLWKLSYDEFVELSYAYFDNIEENTHIIFKNTLENWNKYKSYKEWVDDWQDCIDDYLMLGEDAIIIITKWKGVVSFDTLNAWKDYALEIDGGDYDCTYYYGMFLKDNPKIAKKLNIKL